MLLGTRRFHNTCSSTPRTTVSIVRPICPSGIRGSYSSLGSRVATCFSSAAGAMGDPSLPSSDAAASPTPASEKTYTPFPRLREGDPYRLLGLRKEASFEEVVNARNYLYEEYKWHEPSRESIEMAYDNIVQERLKGRHKTGFRGGRGGWEAGPRTPSLERRISDLFDPTITVRTLINEGVLFIGLAFWALTSGDQSFPLTGAFAYSVYKFQSKRVKNNPEGPFLANNPIIGAVLTTVINLGLACGVMALLTAPLSSVIEGSIRQVGGFAVVMIMGALSVYLK